MPVTSYLRATGQYWKYRFFIVTMVVGGVVATVGAFPTSWIGFWLSIPSDYSVVMVMAGVAVVMSGFIFACLSIRCSVCRTRLFWHAMTRPPNNQFWLDGEFRKCPVCTESQKAIKPK
jgi:hypothetical protein